MHVGEYLFRRLRAEGVDHAFGIPGDFALSLFQAMKQAGLQIVVTTHEPAAGFAADAYARLRGLGVIVVTYGAGALNVVNAVAQAYAEESPVIVVSGAPVIQGRRTDALLHHRVKTFESQINVFREVTGAAVALTHPASAVNGIERLLATIRRTKRPGYLEVPRDVAVAPVPAHSSLLAPSPDPRRVHLDPSCPPALPFLSGSFLMGAGTERGETRHALHEAMREVVARLRQSDRPAVYAGVEIARFGLREKLITLVEKLDLPIATSIEGKAVFPEAHPNFVGIYMGRVGSALAREIVEGSDCLLMLGAFLTDVNTGLFTAQVDRSRVIGATAEETVVGYHRYPDVTLVDLIGRLLESTELPRTFAQPEFPAAARPSAPAHRPGSPDPSLPLSDTSVHDRGEEPLQGDSEAPSRSWAGRRAQGTEKGGQGTPSGLSPDSLADTTGPIRVVGIIEELNAFIARGQYVVVADVGDCLYACTELRTEHFLGPAYYNSVGFGVPAAVGAQLAVPTRRAIALVGDGGFQMTGMELTTARKLGINPIVILWNNTGYATLRAIAGRKPYFDLPAWDYVAIASALGCRGTRVTTREEFREALRAAESSVEVYLIDVEIDSDDLSPTWRQIAAEIRAATT